MAITAPESTGTVTLTIDGREVTVPEGTTIWQAAKAAGIDIPVLCHDERFDPVGVCRMCVVDVGAPAFAASCVRACENGMQVTTDTPELERSRDDADRAAGLRPAAARARPQADHDRRQRTARAGRRYGVTGDDAALPCGSGRGVDESSPVIAVDHDACILCDRCIRACDDIQGNDVIGRSGKGYATHIAFDLERPDGRLVLRLVRRVRGRLPDRRADEQADPRHPDPAARPNSTRSTPSARTAASAARSPTTWTGSAARSPTPTAGSSPASQGRLCVKGRYGWDYAALAAAPDDAADPPRGVLPEGRAVLRRPRRHAAGGETNGHGWPTTAAREKRRAASAAASPAASSTTPRCCRTSARPRWEEALDLVAPRLTRDPRRGRAGRHRRVRQREVLQRGGLPLPEAHPHRLPHQQRGPLHAAVPRLQRGRAVRGDRLRRGLDHLRRHQERRGRDRHRQQLDGEPPGRLHASSSRPGATARRSSTWTRGPTRWPTTRTSTASSSPAPTSPSTTASCTRSSGSA